MRHVRHSEIGHEYNDTVDLTLRDVRCDAQFLGQVSWFLGDDETLNRLDFETSLKALEDVMQVDSCNMLGSEQTLNRMLAQKQKQITLLEKRVDELVSWNCRWGNRHRRGESCSPSPSSSP